MINSVSGEKTAFKPFCLWLRSTTQKIIVLCMEGIHQDAPTRIKVTKLVIDGLLETGTQPDDIYVDPLIHPISTATGNALTALETIKIVKKSTPASMPSVA